MDEYNSIFTGEEIDNAISEVGNKQEKINVRGILKGNGAGGVSAAVAGTDFAPAGYGLGSASVPLTASDDLDSVYKNGWYQWGSAAPQNAPFSYGSMLVVSRNTSDVDQIIFEHNTLRRIVLRRKITNWESWEHVNPPMQVGVEYRTTERYLGKPVYVKAISVGSVVANTMATANGFTTGAQDVIRAIVFASHGTNRYSEADNDLSPYITIKKNAIVYGDNAQVRVCFKTDANVTNCVAVAYYTKSAD